MLHMSTIILKINLSLYSEIELNYAYSHGMYLLDHKVFLLNIDLKISIVCLCYLTFDNKIPIYCLII